jgi:hypothetical protein
MSSDFPIMTNTTLVSVLELRRLLVEILDKRPDICIRFRLIGEMWQNIHYRVVGLTDKGGVLNDEQTNKLIFINDLTQVMQFEIDQRFQQYQPHYHYEVRPFSE